LKKSGVVLVLVIAILAIAPMAHAQATRTWVSGVGDDANPCSRTAPCKTYAGAISKTAAGGIISTLDPGGFGAVTITKSITIEGTGTLGSILNAGTSVTINAASTDVVVLRDLSLHGAGTGTNGVRVLSAAEVYIQNCNIQNNAGDGIDIAPSGAGTTTRVMVERSSIINNTGNGIQIIPSSTGVVRLTVDETNVSGNTSNGIDVTGNNHTAAIYRSKLTHNGANGLLVQLTTSTAFVEGSLIAYNATGVNAGLGAGNTPTVHLSGNLIVGNTSNGVTGSGSQTGYFNNTIVGNTGDNTVTSSVNQQ
jgi:hypothetical protein